MDSIAVCCYVGDGWETRKKLRDQIRHLKKVKVPIVYHYFCSDKERLDKFESTLVKLKIRNLVMVRYDVDMKVFTAKMIIDSNMKRMGYDRYLMIEDDFDFCCDRKEKAYKEINELIDFDEVNTFDQITLCRGWDPQWKYSHHDTTMRGYLRPSENPKVQVFDKDAVKYKMDSEWIPKLMDTREGCLRDSGMFLSAIEELYFLKKKKNHPLGHNFWTREAAYSNWVVCRSKTTTHCCYRINSTNHVDKDPDGPIANYVEIEKIETGTTNMETEETILRAFNDIRITGDTNDIIRNCTVQKY